MKKILLCLSFAPLLSWSQLFPNSNQEKQTTIYAEVFGQGFNGSVNFDQKFNLEKTIKNSYSIGIVFVPRAEGFGDGAYFGIPVSYNWFFGKKNHQLELGLGFTPLVVNEYWHNDNTVVDVLYTYLTPKVGYRFQQADGGLFFRLTATPMIALYNQNFGSIRGHELFNNVAGLGFRAFPWPGASIGWTLKK